MEETCGLQMDENDMDSRWIRNIWTPELWRDCSHMHAIGHGLVDNLHISLKPLS